MVPFGVDTFAGTGFFCVVAPPESEKSNAKKHTIEMTMAQVSHALRLLILSPRRGTSKFSRLSHRHISRDHCDSSRKFIVTINGTFRNMLLQNDKARVRGFPHNEILQGGYGKGTRFPSQSSKEGTVIASSGRGRDAANTLSKSACQTSTENPSCPAVRCPYRDWD